MKLAAITLSLLIAVVPAVSTDSHPVGSVIKLLTELQRKVEDEGGEEQATWAKFTKWCEDNSEVLNKAVKDGKEDIESLTDQVSSLTKKKESVEKNIDHLTDEITKYQAEDTQAQEDRDKANGLYDEADKDFQTTLDAVKDAITALTDSKKGALLQFLKPENQRQEHALRQLIQMPLVLEQLSDEQRTALSTAVFGEADPSAVSVGDIIAKEKYAKAGNTYTFKSGGVIDLLRSLETHFKNEKNAATKAETAAANGHAVAKNSRKDALDAADAAKKARTTELGEVKGDLNDAKSSLQDEKDEVKADSKTLSGLKDTCQLKADQFKTRMKTRKHELDALQHAKEILSLVSKVRTEASDNKAAPTNKHAEGEAALLQVGGVNPKMKALNLLRHEAAETHSKALSSFADQLAAKLDSSPFDQINNMVQKMIFRLMDEQKKEDEHKLWCDQEISVSETSRDDKKDKIDMLDIKIAAAKADVKQLGLDVERLDKKVVELTEFMNDATEIRAEGKRENKISLKDAEAAQTAIAKALAVLTTFYKESGQVKKEEWEFLQKAPEPVSLPDQPESWGKSYTGVTDPENGENGIIAVLKATAEDFARMEADTRSNEISDQDKFDQDMSSASIDKAKTAKESEMKADEKKRKSDKIASMTKQQKHTTSELGAVKQYLKDLKPACVDGDSSYEDRKGARDKEIESLREAQVILEQAFEEKAFLQTVSKHM